MSTKKLTYISLLLALMVVFQSLRLYMPLPMFISSYLIGSLVNACLLLALEAGGWRGGLALALVAPFVAFFQQVLPFAAFIVPIAAANVAYLLIYQLLRSHSVLAVILAATAKFIFLYGAVAAISQLLALPEGVKQSLSLLLGWQQWITAIGGGGIFLVMRKRLPILYRS